MASVAARKIAKRSQIFVNFRTGRLQPWVGPAVLAVSRGQARVGVVCALVIVLDVEAGELGKVGVQHAAGCVLLIR